MARYYPPCLESPALFFVDLSAVAAVQAAVAVAVAAAQMHQLEQYSAAAAIHICLAPYLSRR